jgi:hypothetical protein
MPASSHPSPCRKGISITTKIQSPNQKNDDNSGRLWGGGLGTSAFGKKSASSPLPSSPLRPRAALQTTPTPAKKDSAPAAPSLFNVSPHSFLGRRKVFAAW